MRTSLGSSDKKIVARAKAAESMARIRTKAKALHAEVKKHQKIAAVSYYLNRINDLRDILRKYLTDDEISQIETQAIKQFDEELGDDKKTKARGQRTQPNLESFFKDHPDIPQVPAVAMMSPAIHKLYNEWMDEKNPGRVEQRQMSNRRTESKPEIYFTRIRNEARYKGRRFEISLETALQLINDPCFYCAQTFDTLGIDAVDHRLGFILGNIESCCKDCNKMKADYNVKDFIRIMCNIGAKHSKGITWASNYVFEVQASDVNSTSFKGYQYHARKKGRSFEISKKDFERITSEPCHYCGFSSRPVGLDRVNSEPYYTTANVVPSCGACNRIKRQYTYEAFIAKAKQICLTWARKFPSSNDDA